MAVPCGRGGGAGAGREWQGAHHWQHMMAVHAAAASQRTWGLPGPHPSPAARVQQYGTSVNSLTSCYSRCLLRAAIWMACKGRRLLVTARSSLFYIQAAYKLHPCAHARLWQLPSQDPLGRRGMHTHKQGPDHTGMVSHPRSVCRGARATIVRSVCDTTSTVAILRARMRWWTLSATPWHV